MYRLLFREPIILLGTGEDSVVGEVLVFENPRPGKDGREFRIEIHNRRSEFIEEPISISMSGTLISMLQMHEDDIIRHLVQLRKEVPEVLTSVHKDLFRYPDNIPREEKLHQIGNIP